MGETASIGKFRLIASLGAGGMADVYLSVVQGPMGFNKLAVVKKLRAPLAEDSVAVAMFFDEARLAARLAHPNVIHTYEVGEDRGQYFIAMEFLEGQALNKLAKAALADPFFTPSVWAWILSEALKGLHYAHEAADYDGTPLGIVHRDMTPHNVFVTYGGQVKIVDFGIAKAALNATQTIDGMLKGKVSYMAPEQARGQAVDRRTDVFAAGVVLWELLARKKLFGGDQMAALQKITNEPIPRIGEAVELDPDLARIVDRALARDPEARYQTALEMQVELQMWLRATMAHVDESAVGQAVSDLFQEVRETVKRQIQGRLSGPPPGATGEILPITTGGSVFDSAGSMTPSAPSLKWGVDGARPESAPAPAAPPSVSPQASRRRTRIVIAAALGGALLGILAILLRRPTESPLAAASAAAPGPPPAPAPAEAAVEITSDPPNAVVQENGVVLGRTPLARAMPLGTHVLVVSIEGRPPQTLHVDARAGELVMRRVRFDSDPAPAPSSHAARAAVRPASRSAAHAPPSTQPEPLEQAQPTAAEPPPPAPTGKRVRVIDDETPTKKPAVRVIND